MFSKVALVVVLCVSSAFGGSGRLTITREQPEIGDPITLDHKPFQAHFLASELAVTCVAGGILTLKLSTLNDFALSSITIGADCNSDEFTFPEDADKATLSTSKEQLCGRTIVEQDGIQKYKWDVKVTEKLRTNKNVYRTFPASASVFCQQRPNDADPVVAEPEDLTPVSEGDADYVQPIGFVIVKTDGLVDNHWEFNLKPQNEESIGALNYKIKTCTAKPNHADAGADDQVNIIANSCIDEIGVAVDVTESPKNQKITVYPFQFKDFEESDITLTCLVDLCKDEGCAVIEECPPPAAPERRRSNISRRAQRPKRSVDALYAATTF